MRTGGDTVGALCVRHTPNPRINFGVGEAAVAYMDLVVPGERCSPTGSAAWRSKWWAVGRGSPGCLTRRQKAQHQARRVGLLDGLEPPGGWKSAHSTRRQAGQRGGHSSEVQLPASAAITKSPAVTAGAINFFGDLQQYPSGPPIAGLPGSRREEESGGTRQVRANRVEI